MSGAVVDGIVIGEVDEVRALVERQLTGCWVGPIHPDDRTPIDWLKRAYTQLRERDAEAADRLSDAVAYPIGTLGAEVDGLIIRFFDDYPRASGGERLVWFAEHRLDRFPPGLEDPTPGSIPDELRESLLRAVLRWREGANLPESVLMAARAEALEGRGRALLFDLGRVDPGWMREHLVALIPRYPDSVSTCFRLLVGQGVAPEVALARVLPHASPDGAEVLEDNIRWTFREDEPLRDALLAKLSRGSR